MSEFNKDQAVALYTDLMKLIRVGAYDERNVEGNYGQDGIEEAADVLLFQAAGQELAFHWHEESQTYTLEPMTPEDIFDFVNKVKTSPPQETGHVS